MTAESWFVTVAAGLVGLASLSTLIFFQRAVVRGEAIGASLHWGGLGGGTGGWRVTTALVSLVAALFLWAVAAAMAVYWFQTARDDKRADEKIARDNTRADEAVKLQNQREDAKISLAEKHRDQERADAERAKPQPPSAAPSASVSH